MSFVAISGSSTIVDEFIGLLPEGETVRGCQRPWGLPDGAPRYLIVNGFLAGRAIEEQEAVDLHQAWEANFVGPARAIERILAANESARICVIGSNSGFLGSYDAAYAGAKAALHNYVETRRLPHPGQQLVAIAPGVIFGTAMTDRRTDDDVLQARKNGHPKKRFLWPAEVARLAHFLLYVDQGYISGTVIRMNGGETACQRPQS